ncbi:hypothetical protein [Halorubrum halodurans]|uniref:Uncharacterized protein n=1 Tax=Halorubrum halodurans TaxID=1383851 RepID=A0A256IHC2_9EURY|nr:hypothetical protein [Halorubrum halodurans]OYR55939.1 hypothetical protein DJ70_10505 [Halorubrum halodurans]
MVPEAWYPDRPPTWTDVLVGVLALLWIPINLGSLRTIHWGWVGGGAAIGVVSVGPLANSRGGKRVGAWFRAIGVGGRLAVVLSFAAAVWIASNRVDVPSEIVTSAAGGFTISLVLFLLAYLIRWGEVRRGDE